MTYGPLRGVKIDAEAMAKSCLRQMRVDELTGKPHCEKIKVLKIENLIQ